jgi:hypothetical protein
MIQMPVAAMPTSATIVANIARFLDELIISVLLTVEIGRQKRQLMLGFIGLLNANRAASTLHACHSVENMHNARHPTRDGFGLLQGRSGAGFSGNISVAAD